MKILHPKKIAKTIEYRIDHQLNTLFDYSQTAKICMLDREGRIIGWNSGAERMTGYTSAEVLGQLYSMFISKEDKRRHLIQKALLIAENKGEFVAEGIRVRKNGSHFWARAHFTPMKRADGSTDFFVVMTRDITEPRKIEQRREEYIGIASHELKNPITTLSLYSELLARRLQIDGDKQNLLMLRDIQGQATRLVTLVDDLMIVSMIEGGRLELRKEIFDPAAIVAQIIRGFEKSAPSYRIICTGGKGRNVRADKGRITQVFINLINNAIKYSPHGDTVWVHIGRKRNTCTISIEDSGPGIAKKDLKEIYTRFFRTKDSAAGDIPGSGLGLYISKEILRRHHQRLWAKSVVGKGTTFFFTLPLV